METNGIHQPAFNIENLEGAVLYMLQVCDNLSDVALNDFVQLYAGYRGKRLKGNYATAKLLPRLIREGKVFRIGSHLYSLNPMVRGNRPAQDAFWVYLEYLNSIEVVGDTLKGPYPAQISFVKDNKIYHIIRVSGAAEKEMPFLCQLEIEQQQRSRIEKEKYPPNERYIIIFDSVELAEQCSYRLNSPVLFGTIHYDEGQYRPQLKFFYPDKASSSAGQ